MNPELIARHFHEIYENLAPGYGPEIREDSAVSWEDLPTRNRHLLITVVKELLKRGIIS